MKFKRFVNDPPQTPYAPTWDFRVSKSLCDDIDVNSLSQFLVKREREIKKLPPSIGSDGKKSDGYTGLGLNNTTSKFKHYNLLSWDHSEIKKLKTHILTNFTEERQNEKMVNAILGPREELELEDWLTDLKRLESEAWQSLDGVWPFNWAQKLWWEKHGQKHETEVCSDCLNPYDLTYDEDEEMWLCPRCI